LNRVFKKVDRKLNDVELSKCISSEVCEDYVTGLEFIKSNPDYSLTRFRNIANSIVCKIAEKNNIKFESDKLAEKIQFLFECQLLSNPLKSNLHLVRKLGNTGAHNGPIVKGEGDLHKVRKENLIASAHDARMILVSVFEDMHYILNNVRASSKTELVSAGHQEYREVLYDALTTSNYKVKFKAGIICEAIAKEQSFDAPLIVSSNFLEHIKGLKRHALSFYESSCVISADIDTYQRIHKYQIDNEKIICQWGNVEALYKYADLAIFIDFDESLKDRGMSWLKSAADRKYGPAEALYGALQFENEVFDQARHYLSLAEQKDEVLALRMLFHFYTSGKACQVDPKKALEYLKQAVELGCSDSIATLGIEYHKGVIVDKNDVEAKKLLELSVEGGSSLGKNYLTYTFNDFVGQAADWGKQIAADLIKEFDKRKQKPITNKLKAGANEPCPCGSGDKYKKCCKNNPDKSRPVEDALTKLNVFR
jgi:hypothetical protein